MIKYKYVFVVLVYKNINVLRDFFKSLNLNDCKVIVVNSYYDEISLSECKQVAIENDSDFIPIDNKGYGFGNNVGAKYAIEHYKYDYLILSNSDIKINSISFLDDVDENAKVIAPYIHLNNGKIQNPNIPWNIGKILFPLLYNGYKGNKSYLLYMAHALTRILRETFLLYHRFVKKNCYKIYCCHGAFVIFTAKAVENLYPFFNEDMFLNNEELFLAENCRRKEIPIYYCPKVDVLHLEGASRNKEGYLGFKNNKQSFLVFYKWLRNNN